MPKHSRSQQQLFIDAYVRGKNAAAAAREAGYSHSYAEKAASFLLDQPHIKEQIEAERKKLRDKAHYDVEQGIAEIDDLIAFAKSRGQAMAAANLIQTKLKLLGLLTE